jgi:hypothetical protein
VRETIYPNQTCKLSVREADFSDQPEGIATILSHCSAVQCSAVQCRNWPRLVFCCSPNIGEQCSGREDAAVQCSAVQCSAVQCSAVAWPGSGWPEASEIKPITPSAIFTEPQKTNVLYFIFKPPCQYMYTVF